MNVHVGQEEFLSDEHPDTSGHPIAVHLQHWLGHFDLVVDTAP